MILQLSPTCVSLSPRNKYAMDALGCMVPCFSPPLLPLLSTCFAVCCGCFEPHEPALLSHIRSKWSGPPESKRVSLVSHLSPTVSKYAVGALGRIILHLYRTCLWMLWAAWFCVCTPLVSHLFLTLRVLRATRDSALVSPFSILFSHTCRQVAHRLTPTVSKYAVGALGRMSLHLSPVQWVL